MPGPSDISRGNISVAMMLGLTISPSAVGANTTAEQTFTLPGVLIGDVISATKPTTQAGLGVVNARVSANNTVAIAFCNTTGGGLTPTAGETYIIELNRPSNLPLPTAIT